MEDATGDAIAIPHLWGLAFGNGGAAGPTNTLYFTAGLSSTLQGIPPFHGLFGSLTVAGDSEEDQGFVNDDDGDRDEDSQVNALLLSPDSILTATA